ncbi:hypothetical protein [Micromonospora sp. 067-2]|uniref:hypothetical protein n=1 Tax=Micromonospora sp. 067-2 TaxID=2789270 RepID=UPI00397910F6
MYDMVVGESALGVEHCLINVLVVRDITIWETDLFDPRADGRTSPFTWIFRERRDVFERLRLARTPSLAATTAIHGGNR